MKTTIRPMGNSQCVIIPKPLLAQIGFEGEADMTVEHGALVLRKSSKSVRPGWAEAAKKIAAANDDMLVMPEFANAADAELTW